MDYKNAFMLILLLAYYQRCNTLLARSAENNHSFSSSLQILKKSAMSRVLQISNRSTYIVHFGLVPAAFDELHSLFKEGFPGKCSTGHPRSFDNRMILALVLTWLRGTMKQETLCLLFGATTATVSRSKRLGLETLKNIFNNNRHDPRWAIISWHTPAQMDQFNQMVRANTTNAFEADVVDGLNLPIYNPETPLEQNAYYNGWKSGTIASQVLVFTTDGCICYAR